MTTVPEQPHASTSEVWRSALSLAAVLLSLLFAGAWAQAQTFTLLRQFPGNGDGRYPYGALLRDGAGNLYGTTGGGGAFDYGTVFEISSSGKESILHSFWGGDGLQPWAGLVRDPAGNFYGTTYDGGSLEKGQCRHGCGTVFKLDNKGNLTVLHAFTGGTDGGQPQAGLVRDKAGNLYGTTTIGGDLSCGYGSGCGLVFKLDKDGKEIVLHAFSNHPDGGHPRGDLIRDKAGNFYGTTESGGSSDYGTVFKLDPSGNETVLYSFSGITSGEYPVGRLARDADGNLYGTTNGGGDPSCYLCGVVFKIDKAGNETVLHTFTGNPDGAYPFGGLTRDRAGNLYGSTYAGGGSNGCYTLGCGSVFKVDANGNETVLHGFTGGSDGEIPFGAMIVDKSGNLYGTAPAGGNRACGQGSGCGVVFKLTP
jgi:uncharacterized repeat protein (TIGR03803 family)